MLNRTYIKEWSFPATINTYPELSIAITVSSSRLHRHRCEVKPQIAEIARPAAPSIALTSNDTSALIVLGALPLRTPLDRPPAACTAPLIKPVGQSSRMAL